MSPLMMKLAGGLAAALLLLALVMDRNHWRSKAKAAETEIGVSLDATRTASANPKLARKDMAAQIRLLGTAITDLKAGIARQNAAVGALGARSAAAQAEAAKAAQAGQKRAQGAEATAERLWVSSRSAGPPGACEPSKTVKETWR